MNTEVQRTSDWSRNLFEADNFCFASTDGVFLSKVIDLEVQGFNVQIHRNCEVSWWIYKFVNVVLPPTSQTVSSFVVLTSDHLHLHMSDAVLQLLATSCIIASAAKDQEGYFMQQNTAIDSDPKHCSCV